MKYYKLTNSEMKFAELIWANEPIASMELVKLSEQELGWKKSTTFTFLKTMCEKGIFINDNAMVSAVLSKDDLIGKQSRRYVEDTFGGSLPKFITSFMGGNKLSDKQAKELMRLIEAHKED